MSEFCHCIRETGAHSRSDSAWEDQVRDLAKGSRSEPWGCRSSAQSEVHAFIVTALGGRVRPQFVVHPLLNGQDPSCFLSCGWQSGF